MPSIAISKISRGDLTGKEPHAPAAITEVKHGTSYNWLEAAQATPTIAVPGSPNLWITPATHRQVKKDQGLVYINQNAARHPQYPLEPIFRAMDITDPQYDIRETHVVTDRNNIRKLLAFIDPNTTTNGQKAFTFNVEMIKDTALFQREEAKSTGFIGPREHQGFGHNFEKAFTVSKVKGSTGHHRVVSYFFGGLKCLVRYEVDGYVKNEPAHPTGSQNENTGSKIEGTESKIENTGAKIENTGSNIESTAKIENTGAKIGNTDLKMRNIGSDIKNTGSNIENTGSNIENTGSNIDNTGSTIDNTGSNIDNKESQNKNMTQPTESAQSKNSLAAESSQSKKSQPVESTQSSESQPAESAQSNKSQAAEPTRSNKSQAAEYVRCSKPKKRRMEKSTQPNVKLLIKHEGQQIPGDSTLEIKTRTQRRLIEDEEVIPQLWVGQTHKLVRGYHTHGHFEAPEVEDMTALIKLWEVQHQTQLKMLAELLRSIITLAKQLGGKVEVSFEPAEDKLVVTKTEKGAMLPNDLYLKWQNKDLESQDVELQMNKAKNVAAAHEQANPKKKLKLDTQEVDSKHVQDKGELDDVQGKKEKEVVEADKVEGEKPAKE